MAAWPTPADNEPRRDVTPRMGAIRVRTPTAELAVYDSGGAGPPIVLLHGGPGVPDYLRPVAAMLAAHHRVITFDQRGVGASVADAQRYAIADYLADLEAIRAYTGGGKLALFGHSWGGLLAQLYTAAYPDQIASLFLASPSTGVGHAWRAMEQAVMRHNWRRSGPRGAAIMGGWSLLALLPGALGRRGLQGTLARVWRNYFPDPSAAPAADPAWLGGINPTAMALTRRAILRADPACLGECGATPAFPLLVLFGTDDIYGDEVRRLVARYPGATHVRLAGTGHLPWLQAPERFKTLLTGFHRHGRHGTAADDDDIRLATTRA